MTTITKTIDVEVEIDLDDFDDDEVLEAAQSRGLDPYWEISELRDEARQGMFRALSLGDEKKGLGSTA